MERDELLQLLNGLSPEKIASLKRELFDKGKKSRNVKHDVQRNGHVQTYNKVHVHIHCTTCGSTHTVSHDITSSSMAFPISKEGKVTSIKISGDKEVQYDTYTNNCTSCISYIQSMSREELEERYLSLLEKSFLSIKLCFIYHNFINNRRNKHDRNE